MDRSLENHTWRRSFAAGVVALGLSLGGQYAFADDAAPSCSRSSHVLSARQWLFDHFAPRPHSPLVVQKVTRAAMALMLGTCS